MARECIRNCPEIAKIIDDMEWDNVAAGLGPIHPDSFDGEDTGVSRLLSVCERSYDCQGPKVEPVEVVKGFFKKRTTVEDQLVCGNPEDNEG